MIETGSNRLLKSMIESLILASEKPVTLKDVMAISEIQDEGTVQKCIQELIEFYKNDEERGIVIVEGAGGFQFRTKESNAKWVKLLVPDKVISLSKKALTTLAILAYQQPVTRAEIDKIRGTDSGPMVRQLLKRRLIRILGKKDVPGKPVLYGTTPFFLEYLVISSLKDLPPLRELEAEPSELSTIGEESLGSQPPSI